MKWWVGTSGYSYKEWKGPFYPEKLAAKDMLSYYAQHLTAVEINNTFYRSPKTSVLDGWSGQVGEDFRFVLKATRRITHFSRLKESAIEPLGYLLRTAATLGDRLGPILFQLPPNMKADPDLLEEFLRHLPEGTRAAFEFRHESWNTDEVRQRLRARNVAVCVADAGGAGADGADDVQEPSIVSTADYGYLRLRGQSYDDKTLQAWLGRIQDAGWKEAYVFFKHEDAGAGPRLAARFLELVNA